MSYNNDFLEEIEVLQAIYEEELNVSVSTESYAEMNITIHPNTADDEEGKYVCLTLHFQFAFSPQSNHCYPNKEPNMLIRNPRGLSDSHLASIEENLKILAKSMTGEQMMFSLIEYAKESLTDNNHPSCCCSICLENFVEGGHFFRTACYHYFHRKCIKSYVTISENMICPVCRLEFEIDDSIMKCDDSPEKNNNSEEFVPDSKFMAWRERCNEIYEKQKRKGGIIDLEFEKNKYLITSNDTLSDNNSPINASECTNIEMDSSVTKKLCSSPKVNRGSSPVTKVDQKYKLDKENGRSNYYLKRSDHHSNDKKFRSFHNDNSRTSAYSEHAKLSKKKEDSLKTDHWRENDNGKHRERNKSQDTSWKNENIRSHRKDDDFNEKPKNEKNYRRDRRNFEGENKNPHRRKYQNIDKYGTRDDQNHMQRRQIDQDNCHSSASDKDVASSLKNEVVVVESPVENVLCGSENNSIADTNVSRTNEDDIRKEYTNRDKKTKGGQQNPTGRGSPNQKLLKASHIRNNGDSTRTDASINRVDSFDKANSELSISTDALSDLVKEKLTMQSVPPGFEILGETENLGSEGLNGGFERNKILDNTSSMPPGFYLKQSNPNSEKCKKTSRVPPGFTANNNIEHLGNLDRYETSYQGSSRNSDNKREDYPKSNRHRKRTPKNKSCIEKS